MRHEIPGNFAGRKRRLQRKARTATGRTSRRLIVIAIRVAGRTRAALLAICICGPASVVIASNVVVVALELLVIGSASPASPVTAMSVGSVALELLCADDGRRRHPRSS